MAYLKIWIKFLYSLYTLKKKSNIGEIISFFLIDSSIGFGEEASHSY